MSEVNLEELIEERRAADIENPVVCRTLFKKFENFSLENLSDLDRAKVLHNKGLLIFAPYNFNKELQEKSRNKQLNAAEISHIVQDLSNAIEMLHHSLEIKKSVIDINPQEVEATSQCLDATSQLMMFFANNG